mmetsp:Transcript_8013/g.19272  ORF Transcript_8013/g.19272 Transcript_8013/m.19272 type:complete len:280 (+) Transcript_8013:1344-2183(+)
MDHSCLRVRGGRCGGVAAAVVGDAVRSSVFGSRVLFSRAEAGDAGGDFVQRGHGFAANGSASILNINVLLHLHIRAYPPATYGPPDCPHQVSRLHLSALLLLAREFRAPRPPRFPFGGSAPRRPLPHRGPLRVHLRFDNPERLGRGGLQRVRLRPGAGVRGFDQFAGRANQTVALPFRGRAAVRAEVLGGADAGVRVVVDRRRPVPGQRVAGEPSLGAQLFQVPDALQENECGRGNKSGDASAAGGGRRGCGGSTRSPCRGGGYDIDSVTRSQLRGNSG